MTASRTTPTPTSQSGGGGARPVASPVGSAGSRSNTPASVTGKTAQLFQYLFRFGPAILQTKVHDLVLSLEEVT